MAGAETIARDVPGYLAQRPVAQVTRDTEQLAHQATVRSGSTFLVPAGTVLRHDSTVEIDGVRYAVEGKPAARRGTGGAVEFVAAFLVELSDVQQGGAA